MPPKPRSSVVFTRKREYSENALINCAREKEIQLVRVKSLSIDRWFSSRFLGHEPFFTISNEFRMMDQTSGNWDTTGPRQESFYVKTATGGGNTRRIQVNANIVGGGDFPTYIACEGPTNETAYDFWMLVWQENVSRILSVNFPFEERQYKNDQAKYAKETTQYWPIVEGSPIYFMPFKLTCIEMRMMAGDDVIALREEDMVYRITRLIVRLENNIIQEEPAREIIHMCYYRWPDARIPIPWGSAKTSRKAAVELMTAVEKELRTNDDPLLVHCHAGIGRTGVVIATDMALCQMRNTHCVNIKEVVELLRSKRPRSVMNSWQYAMIHLIVAEMSLKEQLFSDTSNPKVVNTAIDELWTEVNREVSLYFGNEVITYKPDGQ